MATKLSATAWAVARREPLLDPIDLLALEVRVFLGESKPAHPLAADRGLVGAWRAAASDPRFSNQLRAHLEPKYSQAGKGYQQDLRALRKELRPSFAELRELGHVREWNHTLAELIDDGHMLELVRSTLSTTTPSAIRQLEKLSPRDVLHFPGGLAGFEYHAALTWSMAEESGKAGKAEPNDLSDLVHATYSGVVEVFVTDDALFADRLQKFVLHKRAKIIRSAEFIDLAGGARELKVPLR